MEYQNVTLRLNKDLLRKVRVLAAQQDSSISGLLSEYLLRFVEENESYHRAQQRAVELLDQGLALGNTPLRRESIYDR